MDADEIARLRALLAKATPGPWLTAHDADDDASHTFGVMTDDAWIGDLDREADLGLAIAVLNALPVLLDALDEARRLPVIATCGQCADCYPPSWQAEEDTRQADCSHVDAVAGRRVDRNREPPDWCPLRGAR